MSISKVFRFSLFVMITTSMTSCCKTKNTAQVTSSTQEITLNIENEPCCLDPRKARKLYDLNLLKGFNEGLYREDLDGNLKEAIAKKVTKSEDQKTYTIELKKTYWSNGDPLTAHDFIYSWKSSVDKAFPTAYSAFLYRIKNARAIKEEQMSVDYLGAYAKDDYTLVVELETPTPFFKELLSLPAFFPVKQSIVEHNPDWHYNPETFICNGPFKLETWKMKNKITAVKNDYYWDTKNVKLQKLNMLMLDPTTAYKMYNKKQLQWAGSPYSNIPCDVVEHLQDSETLKKITGLIVYMLKTNTEKYPMQNENLRKSLAYAINRKDIVEHVLYGAGSPATALVPACLNNRTKGFFEDGNSKKALEHFELALKELSLTKENFPTITISYDSTERNHKIISAIQDNLRKVLKINIQIEPYEKKVCLDKISSGNFQLVLCNWIADYRDATGMLEVFKTKHVGTNCTNWESLDYISAIDNSYTCTTSQKRLSLLNDAEAILMNELPLIPLYHQKLMYVQDEKLKDVILSETGCIDFKYAYIEN
ncbi:MAG: Oligopeptide-binding protein OppA [Chlamydiia bacterium]|nr:Oligopeptide-binding protein OppA [Chlamydiia bacterium]